MKTAAHLGWSTRSRIRASIFPKASGVGYLIFAAVMAAVTIGLIYFRSRPTDDPTKSVDSFRRAMHALGPEKRTKKRKAS